MGNTSSNFIPNSRMGCWDPESGTIDPYKAYLRRKKENEAELEEDELLELIIASEFLAAEEQMESDKEKQERPYQKRAPARQTAVYRDQDGEIRALGPKQTEWYRLYVEEPNLENMQFRRKFRRRFRMSYVSFQKHLEEVKSSRLFNVWSQHTKDCTGREASPIELLLLGTLRYYVRKLQIV